MDRESAGETRHLVSTLESLIDKGRVMDFSDSVFAFAATLLVLKINIPDTTLNSADIFSALVGLWPQYLANIITFLVIAFYWLNHHAIFGLIKRFDRVAVWLNILFLISLSFLPFPVDLFGDNSSEPVIVAFYSLSIALVGFLLAVIWVYASWGGRLLEFRMSQKQINYYTFRYLIAPVVFLFAATFAFIDPLIAQFSWLFVILGMVSVKHLYSFRN